jgi:hypothetical protein
MREPDGTHLAAVSPTSFFSASSAAGGFTVPPELIFNMMQQSSRTEHEIASDDWKRETSKDQE